MNEELLSSSDRYLKKSNKMLLIVGIIAFLAFLTGVIVLLSGGEEGKKDAEVTIDGSAESSSSITGGNADTFNLAEGSYDRAAGRNAGNNAFRSGCAGYCGGRNVDAVGFFRPGQHYFDRV